MKCIYCNNEATYIINGFTQCQSCRIANQKIYLTILFYFCLIGFIAVCISLLYYHFNKKKGA